ESRLSGISRTLNKGERWLYRRRFTLPDGFVRGRVLLHFGATDQIARVSVNGVEFPAHTGGYLAFSFDITDALIPGENVITVEVTDELDHDLAYGKQRKKRGGMWYTPISGIWQSVWLESVPEVYIRALRITPSLSSVVMETEGGADEKIVEIATPDGILTHRFTGSRTEIAIENPKLWSPESPHLYRFTLKCGEDAVRSYFALRTVTVDGPRILFNGKPRFFHGLLDQGYYSDGIYLPASPRGYEWDILEMKRLGFDTLRKHIKIEPEAFYYFCDLHGMIVFQDLPNSGGYSFLIDTALPTVGLRRGITHHASKRRRAQFLSDMAGMVHQLYNHPSVCYYTIFNEGWGQFDADFHYDRLKELDPTRVIDTTSGWFFEKKSDVQSEHIYFKALDLHPDGRPLVLSEFGGYSCRIDDHAANLTKSYGYKTMTNPADLTESLRRLYLDQVVPMIGLGLTAAILTQVSDVEDEINGLVTYDRQITKPDGEVMREIAEKLRAAFAESEKMQ
ncbi:MAG: glycoside hydrolase family 2, partial [Ruminococcaceae bacterium]|nr:glycoside hydrolase family 2 [Oscillospiraceae bacterium]